MAVLPACTRYLPLAGMAPYRHFCAFVCGFCALAAIAGRVAGPQWYEVVDTVVWRIVFLESFHHMVGVEQHGARCDSHAGAEYTVHDPSLGFVSL